MTQWEHLKIDLSAIDPKSDDVALLNAAGYQGWELIAITANNIAYLRRALRVAAAQKTTTSASKRGAVRVD